jgi:peptidoglycan/LPS O-acetylase OafA/YrhL
MPSRLEHTHNLAAQNAKLIRPFMPELDMLRGVAVLGVLLLHAFYWKYGSAGFGPWSGKLMEVTRFGWTGVNLFFVLDRKSVV